MPLVLAAIILAFPLIENGFTQRRITNAAQSAQASLTVSNKVTARLQGIPNRILVPSLLIDLPVVSQSYSPFTKTWPVSAATANYAAETAPINNNKGESLLYGHNNRAVFGPLLNLKPGDIVYVYTDNGHLFKYSYLSSQDVSPRQTDVIADMANSPAGLKMITCDGPYFQYRHLMSFKLIKSA